VFTARYGLDIWISWIRRLVDGLLLRRPGFGPLSVHLRFMEDKLTTEQGFLGLLVFSPVSIIPPMLHLHLHLHVLLIKRTNGRSPGTLKNAVLFRKFGDLWIWKHSTSIIRVGFGCILRRRKGQFRNLELLSPLQNEQHDSGAHPVFY
jgi:hypothetical protein